MTKARAKVGRPQEYDRLSLAAAFQEYIEATEIPIIAEFAYKNNVVRDTLYDWPEFATLLKKCVAKKEAALESKALAGDVNVAMAIFSLKQLGWSDKQDIKHNIQPIAIDGKLATV
jgi:hypothetical protein